jgi:hypothetical protein
MHHLSVAETWGITDEFGWSDPDLDTLAPTIVTQAQATGVLDLPAHRVEVRALVPDTDGITEYLVLLRAPTEIGLASAPLAADDLADPDLTGVDAAVAVVINTARTVQELLTAQQAITHRTQVAPFTTVTGHAFAPLHGVSGMARLAVPPPASAPPPERHTTR